MASKELLALKVRWLETFAKRDSSPEVSDARDLARRLLDTYPTDAQSDDAKRTAAEIIDLASSAADLADAKTDKSWPRLGIALLVVVFGLLAWFLYTYAERVGFETFATIEGTRPLLVIAAIISTIAFGGALLMGSLFSSEGAFEDRFRRAREIFLVFSGIFGTVIGFYFGAGDTSGSQLGVSAFLDQAKEKETATLFANATAGSPPYTITVTYGPGGLTKVLGTTTGWASFVFVKKTDNLIPMTVSAIDGKNRKGSTIIDLNQDDLKKNGWALPEQAVNTPTTTGAEGKAAPEPAANKTVEAKPVAEAAAGSAKSTPGADSPAKSSASSNQGGGSSTK